MTQEQKAQAYDEVREKIALRFGSNVAEEIFSKFEMSEDEKIRNFISNELACLRATDGKGSDRYEELTNAIVWLEKQGTSYTKKDIDDAFVEGMAFAKNELEKQGQKPTDKVESRFKIGDWIVDKSGLAQQVLDFRGGIYTCTYNSFTTDCESNYHLWTIEDAKNGDVLASNHNIFIFSQEYMAGKPEAHCGIMNGLFIVKPEGCWTNEKCYPATKEQQDILYQKMNKEGYEWLADKKELKMIEQKPAESRQKTKPNGGIVYEDFNEGDGYYKVNLAYLSKSQVELIENLVASWQNPTNNTVEWSEEDEKNLAQCIEAIDACYKWDSMIDWLKSLRSRSRWKPSEEQMKALHDMNLTGNISYAGQGQILIELYNDLKKL